MRRSKGHDSNDNDEPEPELKDRIRVRWSSENGVEEDEHFAVSRREPVAVAPRVLRPLLLLEHRADRLEHRAALTALADALLPVQVHADPYFAAGQSRQIKKPCVYSRLEINM